MTAAVAPAASPLPSARIEVSGLSPGDVARLLEILVVLARHGVVVVARRGTTIVIRPRSRAPRALAVALRRSFADLGPTFVKFGQLVASSPGLFPPLLSEECRKLLDRVPPVPAAQVRETVERELGAPIDVLFAEFAPEPLAAASIAQVHEALLHDGRRVVVKVRRPRLAPRIGRDLRLLRLLALAIERAGSIGRLANPVAIVDDFATTLVAELDFRSEATAMTAFARNLESSPDREFVVVPEVIDEMVTPRVLVMGFVDGRPVDHVAALRADGHDLEALLRVGVRAWLEGALVHGFFHGDVHAGNLFVTPDGRVAFLDFGITGRLDERVRRVLRDALPAVLIERDFARVVEAFFELGAATGPLDAAAAAADVEALATPLLSRPIAEISYGDILAQVLRVATRHRVRLPRELVLVVKQILYFERYAKEMAPDYQILADPALIPMVLGEPPSPSGGAQETEAPRLPRPATRALGGRSGGIIVPSRRDATFTWRYGADRPELHKLYDKAKRSQWNAATDIDWAIDVDPLDSGAMSDYLPLVAADAFARFSDRERAEAAYQFNAWITSQFLHGEQGALLATSKLVQQVPDLDAKLYGASQVLDEARHVEVYGRYLREKLELTYPVNPNLSELLELVVADSRWDVTYLGMQVVVEGLALAAFGLIHQFSSEPLIKQITRYVMADEARHVAFGTLSLTGLYEQMSDGERRDREDFVAEAAWLMRDRFLAEEVWERLGIPAGDGLRDAATSPMLQLFQRVLFAKITPTLTRIGLLTPRLRDRLVSIGAIAGDLA